MRQNVTLENRQKEGLSMYRIVSMVSGHNVD